MTSFINLMADDAWSEADIVNRTEALLRSEFSISAERILSRKIQGAGLGQYTLLDDELAQLAQFALASEQARVAGNAAREDMALLGQVKTLEAAQARLARTPVEPVLETSAEGVEEVTNQSALEGDAAERAVAQAVVDSASAAAQALYLLRNPVIEVTPEPAPEEPAP